MSHYSDTQTFGCSSSVFLLISSGWHADQATAAGCRLQAVRNVDRFAVHRVEDGKCAVTGEERLGEEVAQRGGAEEPDHLQGVVADVFDSVRDPGRHDREVAGADPAGLVANGGDTLAL